MGTGSPTLRCCKCCGVMDNQLESGPWIRIWTAEALPTALPTALFFMFKEEVRLPTASTAATTTSTAATTVSSRFGQISEGGVFSQLLKNPIRKVIIFSKSELHMLLTRKCVSLNFTIMASSGVIVKLIIE